MADITAKNISRQRAGLKAGELVYECDDGAVKSEIIVRVAAKNIPGAVVWVPHCCCCDADGEHDLGLTPHEVTFMLGESDADPATVFDTMMAEQAKRAHRAKRQMDGMKALALPAVPMPVTESVTFARTPKEEPALIEGGAGNDLLVEGGK